MSLLIAQKNVEIVVIQAIYDTDGRTRKTGLAGTIVVDLRDEGGEAAETVVVTEQGASGYYEFVFTPIMGRAGGYSYQLDIIAPDDTSDESIYGFEIRVFDSVQFAATTGSFLTTLAKVKGFCTAMAAGDTAHDSLITDLIARATDRIEEECDRKLISATFTELIDGGHDPLIRLSNPPIASITSLHEDTDQTFDGTTLIAAADYIFDRDNSGGFVRKKANVNFAEGFQNVQAIYVGGFATIPAALEQAAMTLVCWWFSNRYKIGVSSASLRETQSTRLPMPSTTPDLRALIRPWLIPRLP
ncbi:hypothetical protein LCGC14_0427630 [marine sediment metagenome]|uniref:Uncharacterized protein n=1 Tax=marine sediment metagenome TaxID=412755 RepID=A0A0F9VYI7_9ZZZZ